MKIVIHLRNDVWEKIQGQALAEYRFPKQQIEFLLHRAITEREGKEPAMAPAPVDLN